MMNARHHQRWACHGVCGLECLGIRYGGVVDSVYFHLVFQADPNLNMSETRLKRRRRSMKPNAHQLGHSNSQTNAIL